MRTGPLALAVILAAAILPTAFRGSSATARAGEGAGPVYVSGDAHLLTFWRGGELPQAVTYALGHADAKIGTGPREPGEEAEERGPPMLFRTGPKTGNWLTPRTEDLITVGSVRWDEERKVFASTGPGDALTLWWLEDGEPARARLYRRQVVSPFLEHEERQIPGKSVEEFHVSVPAKTVVDALVFEKAPAGRIPGPDPLR